MSFGATPLDGSATPIPMSSAVPDGTNTPLAVEGGPSKSTGGNSLAPVAVYQYDGYNVAQGATTDTAVTGDNTGSMSAKLRGLNKVFADIWDNVNHLFAVNVKQFGGQTPTLDNTTIQAVSMRGKGAGTAGDTAVLLDSLGRVLTGRNAVAVYSLASTLESASGNSGDLAVGAYTEIGIDVTTTAQAGTSPTLQLFWERKGADGLYYILWQSAVLSAATNTISTSVGAGMSYPASLGVTGRFRWVLGGSAGPSYTFSANVYGK